MQSSFPRGTRKSRGTERRSSGLAVLGVSVLFRVGADYIFRDGADKSVGTSEWDAQTDLFAL